MLNVPPPFWTKSSRSFWAFFLWPLLFLFQKVYLFFLKKKPRHPPLSLPIPVFCIGNLTVGGQGKTPTCLSLFDLLKKKSIYKSPHFITRGYRGFLQGPVPVHRKDHSFLEVGDEPLLLAQKGPTWKGKRRRLSALAAYKRGASCLIMDDGFQNKELAKDISFLVIDGGYGFGNGKVLPCGPLREPLKDALTKATAIVLIGSDTCGVSSLLKVHAPDLPIFYAQLVPKKSQIDTLRKKRIFAFAGIGLPEKFFSMLESHKLTVVKTKSFKDHHAYTLKDLDKLMRQAHGLKAQLVTTEKDLVRIPSEFKKKFLTISVELSFEKPNELLKFIQKTVAGKFPPLLHPSQKTTNP